MMAAETFVARCKAWAAQAAHWSAPSEVDLDLGTQNLPTEVVAQEVVLLGVGLTNPDDPRSGAATVGVWLGDDEHEVATEDERTYVLATIDAFRGQIARRPLAPKVAG